MNLIIVNDERLTADTMKKDIPWGKYGISQVFTAYDAEEGKACIEEHPIDIMLCDIEMPGENGLELLRWVRENRKDIECVFLTCHAKFAYAQEAISLGCQDYILVPAKYEDIGDAILKVVRRLKERREASRYREYGKYMMEEQVRQDRERKEAPENTADVITRAVMKNLTNHQLSVDMLAEEFHFHPVYLNRLFKKEKGVSVSQFIINQRMKMAASLLETGEYSANEVAEKTGYSHYTNFYNMFKKYYGMSPAQYQESHKNE